jgi:hypothetical protein
MTFHLEGKTIPNGAYFKVADAFPTIQAALHAAQNIYCGAAIIWVMDHQRKLILSSQDVKAMLDAGNPMWTP